jgi:predicted molibdopterin-dependent oxidoreductase YjgC
MTIETHSEDVIRGRRTILELLASTIHLDEAPEILEFLKEYGADTDRFEGGKRRTSPIYDDNPFYLRDYNQCINCWRCVQVCADDAQFTYALSFDGRGFETRIGTFLDAPMPDTTCVFCGQCVGACPTGALKPKRQALLEQGMNPDDIFFATRQKRKKKADAEIVD